MKLILWGHRVTANVDIFLFSNFLKQRLCGGDYSIFPYLVIFSGALMIIAVMPVFNSSGIRAFDNMFSLKFALLRKNKQ